MNDVLIVKNISREGPGLLDAILGDADLTSTIIDLSKGENFPDITAYKALVVLGGPDSANDQTPKMTEELKQVKAAIDAGMPYLGICLGMQVGVKAMGGTVMPAEVKEVGFLDQAGLQNTVEVTETGKTDPLLNGLPDSLTVFHLHGETVGLTDSMQLLGSGKYCENQIVKIADKAYGIQSHFELTEEMLKEWAAADPDLQPLGKESLLNSYRSIQETYTRIGQTYLKNFLRIAGLLY